MARDDISDGQRNKPGTPISGSFLPLLAAVASRLVSAPDERIRVDPSVAARWVRNLAVVRSRKHSCSDGNPPEREHSLDEPALRTMGSAGSTIIVRLSKSNRIRYAHHQVQLFITVS